MKILPIVTNKFHNTQEVQYSNVSEKNIFAPKAFTFNMINFGVSKASGAPLKKLAEYGLPDMYTGEYMLTNNMLSRMLKNGVFELPLKTLVSALDKYSDRFQGTAQTLFALLKSEAKKNPECKIDDALKQLFPEHQKKLLDIQRPIFRKIIQQACDMPKEYLDDLMYLMKYTNQKIERKDTTSHFSEKEFIYRLQQVEKQIKAKKRHTETAAIKHIIMEAKKLFQNQIEKKKKFGRGFAAKKLKMQYQMQPEILKQNIQNLQYLREILDKSVLKNNKDIINIFELTNAKICGFPIAEPFKRQEFIYDLKNIVKFLKNKKLEKEIIKTARELPTSEDNVSAFIVKHVNDTPERIGYYMMKGSLFSIEHILPKRAPIKEDSEEFAASVKNKNKKKKKTGNNVGGKNHINNYGVCSAHINSKRSNMPFDEWIRKTPTAYQACPKLVNRLIELYEKGIFKIVGLDKSYIQNFANRVTTMSPQEKPIVIDMSNFIA